MNLKEVLDIFDSNFDENQFDCIYIKPPEPHVLTDEDLGNEDEGACTSNLSACQLTASAEIR